LINHPYNKVFTVLVMVATIILHTEMDIGKDYYFIK